MNDEPPSSISTSAATADKPGRSWLERLSDALLREPTDKEQLILLLRDAVDRDLIDSEALSMIEGVMQVAEMQVREIMIPRAQMAVVQAGDRPEDFLPMVIDTAHSRFPVISDNKDDVQGILLAKDLLAYFARGEDARSGFDIREVLRPAVFIPESKRLNVLLKDFRANRNHMAIVVDEYGGVSGLVTIEDVLEQIVGEIEDEHDFDEDVFIIKHAGGRYVVKALIPIDEFNEYFSSDFSDQEFDTIGGLVMQQFGRLPKRGEFVDLGRFRFKVLRADNRRVHLLQVIVLDNKKSSLQ